MGWVPPPSLVEASARTRIVQIAARLARRGDAGMAREIQDALADITRERNRLLSGWWGADDPPSPDVLRARAERLRQRAQRHEEAADMLKEGDE